MSSDAFCIIPFARFKKREEGNPGVLMFAMRVRTFGITLWCKHFLRNSQWCKYRNFFRVFKLKGVLTSGIPCYICRRQADIWIMQGMCT